MRAMPEWWTYELADVQIFSARALDRLVERCAREAWPAQPLVIGLGLAVLALLWWRPRLGARALAVASAMACASVAAWWLLRCYAELHWAAGWMAAGFALQALLLAAAGAWPEALERAPSAAARGCAMGLFAFALLVLPWLSMPPGSSGWRAEFLGLMPVPTIAASLAVIPLATRGWRLLLLPLPIAGAAMEALTSASIGRDQWMLLPLQVALLAMMLLALSLRDTMPR
jgi:hypothetical protein